MSVRGHSRPDPAARIMSGLAPITAEERTFRFGRFGQQATFRLARLAQQRRGLCFLQSLFSGIPPATSALRFLTLAVVAPAHHYWCQFFIAAGGDHAGHE
jgi:hypothetical protein